MTPRSPFTPATSHGAAGVKLYRVHRNTRAATEFNPGVGAPTRFGFFGDPVVPILSAAATEDAGSAHVSERLVYVELAVLFCRPSASRFADAIDLLQLTVVAPEHGDASLGGLLAGAGPPRCPPPAPR